MKFITNRSRMSCKLANNMTVVKSTVWIRSYRFLDARHFALFDARRHKRNHQEASAERQEDQTTQLKISLQLLSVPCWHSNESSYLDKMMRSRKESGKLCQQIFNFSAEVFRVSRKDFKAHSRCYRLLAFLHHHPLQQIQ